ncbi:MAG TPA: FprA family A-type flavoprotein [Chthonomonadales bacterium]|nr:FprA family A-type flavoprotein [Chthonomonadales bacterium]
MTAREIRHGVSWVGAIDWERRLFDSLIPIPQGTTYNAYLVRGSNRTALLDTVDASCLPALLDHLRSVERIDDIVVHHVEQDHSGSLPYIMERYPAARVLITPKGREMLLDHLPVDAERVEAIEDGATIDLGGRTLRFLHAPWQHWPETAMSFLEDEGLLFSCDLFGAHLATTDLYAPDGCVEGASRSYYAEIMMPFRNVIRRNVERLDGLDVRLIAPSHGPLHDQPDRIRAAYQDWMTGPPRNAAVVAYVSMHGSTREMVERLLCSLGERGVATRAMDLASTDVGDLADALVDAATLVVATPTVLGGAHPLAVSAAYLANALKPKLRHVVVVGSFGWSGKTAQQVCDLLAGLRAEVLDPVLTRGMPGEEDLAAVDRLAVVIAERHAAAGLV